MLFYISLFPLGASGQVRIQIFQFLGCDEADLPAQICAKLRKAHMESVVGVADGPDNGPDDELQKIQIPVFPGNNLLPVPLVHIDGVDIIQVLIPADGVHIGIQAVAHGEIVSFQGQTLPFCQGVDNLGIDSNGGDVKGYRPLIAVQVVVEAGIFRDKQGSGDTL